MPGYRWTSWLSQFGMKLVQRSQRRTDRNEIKFPFWSEKRSINALKSSGVICSAPLAAGRELGASTAIRSISIGSG